MGRRFGVYLGPEHATESLPGTSSSGSVSYLLTEWLEPTFASVVSDGEIGELRLIAHKHPEDGVPLLPMHKMVKLKDFKNDAEFGEDVFDGVIVKVHTLWGGSEERTEAVCYNGGDYLLHRIAIHGQHRRSYSLEQATWNAAPDDLEAAYGIPSTDVIRIDTPCIFNPEGRPNRTAQKYFLTDSDANGGVYLFDVPGRKQVSQTYGSEDTFTIESKPWKLSEALAYLLTFYPTTWAIDPSSFGDVPIGVFSENGDPVISEMNLEGKSLLDALHTLCAPYNYGFYVSPTLDPTSHKHRIYFYFKTNSQFTDTVRLSPRGTVAGESTANLIHADLVYDASSIVNTISSFGDQISVTTLCHTNPPTPSGTDAPVLRLDKGWKTDDLTWVFNPDMTVNTFDITFRKNYCHPDLISYEVEGRPYGVGRMWVVNLGECPDKSLENMGVALKNGIFNKRNSIDNRRCEKPDFYNRNSPGGLLHQEDIQVEMSFDDGENWDVVERNWYRVLSDHIGIVFTDPMLEKLGIKFKNNDISSGRTYWQALYDDKLRIRILCSVKSDERVSAIRSNIGEAVPLATERIFWNPNGFRKVIVNPAANSSAYYTKFEPLVPEQDDTSQLTELTNLQASYTDRIFHAGQMSVVLGDFNEYHPGVQITEITNRVEFSPAPIVLRAIYDFPNQHVHLVVDSRHVRSVLQARPQVNRSREEANLGIRNLAPVQNAPQVPFIPGDSESFRTFVREGGTP